jgi:hypothetical protein
MIAETARPQPPIQPIHGPNAFVDQVNVVPHRDEREQEHRWRLVADGQHDVAERGRQTVGGRDGRQTDDHIADQADSAGLQTLIADDGGFGFLDCHVGNIRFQWLLRLFNAEIVPYRLYCYGIRR